MNRPLLRAAGGTVMAGGLLAARPGTRVNRLVRHGLREVSRQMRYLAGRLEGVSYRLAGRRPDLAVVDTVLADRIRSQLGPLERRRDLPRVHVAVDDHVALLHGDVPTADDARTVERAVGAVSGVQAVRSHLHVGLAEGDTRPSEGHARHARGGA